MKYGVKMADIAKEFNVSIVTVSNALSGRGGVSAALTQAITKRAAELGYRPSVPRKPRKRAMQEKNEVPRYVVGVLSSESFSGDKGTFYYELIQRLTRTLKGIPMRVVHETISLHAENEGQIPASVSEKSVDAIIVVGQVRPAYIKMLIRLPIPVVFLDFYDEHCDIDSIVSDSYYGGYLLTDYLIGLGHKNIGFVGTVMATSSIHDRFMGYVKALMSHGLKYEEKWTVPDREGTALLKLQLDLPEDLPTAFVCNCDETASRLIATLKAMGKRVPEDISVVGYDNYMVSDMCVPSITTVEVNLELMATAAADIVRKKLETPNYSEGKRMIPAKLIQKNSAAAPAKK